MPHAQLTCVSPSTQFQSNAALFEAVELQDLDRVQELLKQYSPEELDLNTPNSEGLLPLDIAIMTNNAPIARALLQAGAKESPHCELVWGSHAVPITWVSSLVERGTPGSGVQVGRWSLGSGKLVQAVAGARVEPCTRAEPRSRTRRGGWGLGVGTWCQQSPGLP